MRVDVEVVPGRAKEGLGLLLDRVGPLSHPRKQRAGDELVSDNAVSLADELLVLVRVVLLEEFSYAVASDPARERVKLGPKSMPMPREGVSLTTRFRRT